MDSLPSSLCSHWMIALALWSELSSTIGKLLALEFARIETIMHNDKKVEKATGYQAFKR